jgi:uroporphyrinogen III methyltransferase/synthase
MSALAGLRVVVTRAREQAGPLTARLRALGADVVELPVIEIEDPADGGAALADAVRAAREGRYDWVVVTSANGAARLGGLARGAMDAKVAAIGPATAEVLAAAGIAVDVIPERFVAESLVDALPDGPGRVLVARAAVARDALPDGLRAKGWDVDVVEAYRTRPADVSSADLDRATAAGAIAFTAPSTVDAYVDLAGVSGVPSIVACIGPITAAAARRRGLTVTVSATVHTVDGLVDALARYVAT